MKKPNAEAELADYRKKRRFDATPEPDAAAPPRANARTDNLFVIQKHAARRLHYDFRLELDGTLKSWAVPKGPSLDPGVKRMAVHVEDHPLSYADFEGTIPAGNYGAGTVIVWDTGTWVPHGDAAEGYAAGRLKFELRGSKLRGMWNLVRMHTHGADNDAWLLIKERDAEARPTAQYDIVEAEPDSVLNGAAKKSNVSNLNAGAKSARARAESDVGGHVESETIDVSGLGSAGAQPLMIAPQLATLVASAPLDSGWIYEIKFDGYRVLTRISARDGIHVFTRNGNDWTPRLKPLIAALKQWQVDDVWLDGEIVVFDSNGVTQFQALQNAFEEHRTAPIHYMVFDILYYGGRDLRAVPLIERRALLQRLMRGNNNPLLRFSEHIEAKPDALIETACRMHVEGLIGKRAHSIYTAGRTRDWIKLKCMQRQEFVIGGYTDAGNENVRSLGALLLGVHDADGALHYVGKVGTGFTQQAALTLYEKLQPLAAAKNPFAESVKQRGAHWVKPTLIAEIAFGAWTDDGHIRHSSFQGLRSDKPAAAITRELPVALARPTPEAEKPTRKAKAKPKATSSRRSSQKKFGSQVAGIEITHPERVIDRSSGITKYDIARYYESVAAKLLPHLRDRPVSLVRAPDGVGGEIFFQKHRGAIPKLTELDPALMPGHPPLVSVASLETLISCVQMNVVEFHTWNARIENSERPDRVVFDLDPGENIVWPQIIEAAQLMKTMLDELHLKSFLKTSGGKGLHVVVPLLPQDDWQTVRDFSETLVRHMAGALPQLFVATSGPKNRIGRIFIDYLRNNRGSTTAAAFSARLRPGLGVSVPLAWDELATLESSSQWHVAMMNSDVATERAQRWAGYARVRQTLRRAQKILDAIL